MAGRHVARKIGTESSMSAPVAGLKVIEIARLSTGPRIGQALADRGATRARWRRRRASSI